MGMFMAEVSGETEVKLRKNRPLVVQSTRHEFCFITKTLKKLNFKGREMKLIRHLNCGKGSVLAAVLMATGLGLSQYWFHLPRLIMSTVDPRGISGSTWQQGPLKPVMTRNLPT